MEALPMEYEIHSSHQVAVGVDDDDVASSYDRLRHRYCRHLELESMWLFGDYYCE